MTQLQATAHALITEAWLIGLPEKVRPSIFRDEAYKQASLKPRQNLNDHPDRQSIIVIDYQEKVMRISRCWQVSKIGIHTIGEIVEVKGATGFLARLFGGSKIWLPFKNHFEKRRLYMSIDCNIRSCPNEFAQVVIREGDDDLPLCLSCAEAFRLGMNVAQVQFVPLEDWESDETENGAIIFCRISNCQAEAIQVIIREGENDLPLCGTCIEAFSQGMNCPEGQIVSLEEWLSEEDEEDGELPWWDDPAADTLTNKAVMELDFLEEESDVRQEAWWDDPAAETLANMAVKEVFYPGSTIQDGTSSSASPG